MMRRIDAERRGRRREWTRPTADRSEVEWRRRWSVDVVRESAAQPASSRGSDAVEQCECDSGLLRACRSIAIQRIRREGRADSDTLQLLSLPDPTPRLCCATSPHLLTLNLNTPPFCPLSLLTCCPSVRWPIRFESFERRRIESIRSFPLAEPTEKRQVDRSLISVECECMPRPSSCCPPLPPPPCACARRRRRCGCWLAGCSVVAALAPQPFSSLLGLAVCLFPLALCSALLASVARSHLHPLPHTHRPLVDHTECTCTPESQADIALPLRVQSARRTS